MELVDKTNGATKEDLDVLNSKVDSATEELGKINTRNEQYKSYKKDFENNIITALREAYPNMDLKREEKVVKTLFNKIVASKVDEDATDKDNMLVAGYLRKRIEEVVMLIYAFRYLKYNDVTKLFESYGIKMEFEPVEKLLPYLAGTTFKDSVKQYVETSIELKTQTENIKHNIDENIYNEIPATLRYNKEVNPSGIKKGIFKKFSLLKLLKKINLGKAKLKFDKMVEETQIRSKADTLAVSVADTLVSDGNTNI